MMGMGMAPDGMDGTGEASEAVDGMAGMDMGGMDMMGMDMMGMDGMWPMMMMNPMMFGCGGNWGNKRQKQSDDMTCWDMKKTGSCPRGANCKYCIASKSKEEAPKATAA